VRDLRGLPVFQARRIPAVRGEVLHGGGVRSRIGSFAF